MGRHLLRRLTLALLVLSAACTTSQTPVPPLSGPSELALALRVTATPDSISQDGASQSAIAVSAFDAHGRGIPGLALRMDMAVGGTLQDFGTLSARTIVTGSDGRANTVYTAPPSPPLSVGGGGAVVTIVATPTGNDFQASNPQIATIRLVPPGVILPPADTPTAKFTITPTPVNINVAATFDGSTSCGGQINNGQCTSLSQVVSYKWDFGDGGTGAGMTTIHAFKTVGTFNVTLTVTNDRGGSASTTQPVTTGTSGPPTGDWVFSPVPPVVNTPEVFNADGVQAAPGHTIVQFNWDFGDGTPNASGRTATHTFTTAGTFTVVLSALDDAGQHLSLPKALTVGSGSPVASLSLNKAGGLSIQGDGTASTATAPSVIVTYTFIWGDGTQTVSAVPVPPAHNYGATLGPGTYTVTLRVTDNAVPARSGTASQVITVP